MLQDTMCYCGNKLTIGINGHGERFAVCIKCRIKHFRMDNYERD